MQPITMFMQRTCPHSRRAFAWMDEVTADHPEYRALSITMIDEREQTELARQYDYYYVPTFYIGGEKVHEGVASREIIEQVFSRAFAAL